MAQARHGYAGVFAAKSKESMGGVGKMDGCAVFWRTAALRKRCAEVLLHPPAWKNLALVVEHINQTANHPFFKTR